MPRARAAPPLQALRGARADRRGDWAPTHQASSGEPPAGLTTAACEVWWKVVPELKKFSLLNVVEEEALVAYCESVVVHRIAAAEVAEQGIVIRGSSGGYIKNPAYTVMKESAMVIRSFAHEFGLTPASRASVAGPVDSNAETADDFFSANSTGG